MNPPSTCAIKHKLDCETEQGQSVKEIQYKVGDICLKAQLPACHLCINSPCLSMACVYNIN